MNIITREKIKNEAKSIAYKRRLSKVRASELRRMASMVVKDCNFDEDYNGEAFSRSRKILFAADELDYNTGIEARYINVAYGLLKGRDYKEIENKTNTPLVPMILLDAIRRNCSYTDALLWNEARVKSIISE